MDEREAKENVLLQRAAQPIVAFTGAGISVESGNLLPPKNRGVEFTVEVYMYTCISGHRGSFLYVCVYGFISLCIYAYIFIYICPCVCIHVCIYKHIFFSVCVYLEIYAYVYM